MNEEMIDPFGAEALAEFDDPDMLRKGAAENPPDEIEDFQIEVHNEIGEPETLDREIVEKLVRRFARVVAEEREATAFIDCEIVEAQAHVESLRARREELARPYVRRQQWLDQYLPYLQEYAAATLAGQKSRSLKLAYGDIGFRRTPERVEVSDEEMFISWALKNDPNALKMTPSKTGIKTGIKVTGEIPPGVEIFPGEDRFYITPIVGGTGK